MNQENPIIVQSNSSILLEVNNPLFIEARNAVSEFAHLEKSPEYIHTFSITPLSLWNAAALGMTAQQVTERLSRFSKYPLPSNVTDDIVELMGRYGKIVLESSPDGLVLRSTVPSLLSHLARHPRLEPLLGAMLDDDTVTVPLAHRGVIKQVLIGMGYPASDKAGYVDGEPYPVSLRDTLGEILYANALKM